MYPRRTDLTEVWKEKTDSGTIYYAENPNGDLFELSYEEYKAFQMADGIHKPQASDDVIEELIDIDLLTKKRFNLNGIIGTFTVAMIGHRLDWMKGFARVFSTLLPFLTPLVFAVGAVNFWFGTTIYSGPFSWPLHIAFLLFSLTLHEMGHGLVGLANDYDLDDCGILCFFVIPIGAYIRVFHKDHDSTKHKIHLYLAGIEMNLLIAGIMLFGARLFPVIGMNLYQAAMINVCLVIGNLVPIIGLDGEHAISELIGIESIGRNGIRIFTDRKYRKHLLHSGAPGIVCISIAAAVDLISVSYLAYCVWGWVTVLL